MNKIYKVVWNAARNCYVVGSEFISKTRRGEGYCHSVRRGGTKALAAAMTVLALTAGYGVLPVQGAEIPVQVTIDPSSDPKEYVVGVEGSALAEALDGQEVDVTITSFKNAGLVAGTTTTKSTLFGNATAKNNMILGDGAEIYVQGALGKAASVENSMAIGQGAEIHAQSQGSAKHITDSIAFGQDSYVSASNSVAIGADSTATEEGVVSVGSANNQRRIVNVADGNIGENSIDAVNGSQLYAVREGAVSYGTKMEEDLWGNEKEVTDYSIVTLRGENGTKLTNLAAGEFKDGSTDAVTAGQLYDAGIVPGKAADGSVAIGNGSTVTSGAWDWDTNTPLPANGVAIGDNAKVNNSTVNGVVIGQGAEVRTDNATAIGQGSRVASGDGSVALGQGSMVTAADAKGTDAHGVVSVGLTGNKVTEGFTRRIINVADGTSDSDAATYGQVKDVDAKLGDLDFSNTQYLEEAENVADALTKLDTKAYNLSGKIDDFSRSGIMAGGTLDSRNAGTNSIQLGNQARAAGQNSIAFGAGASVTGENTEESILTRAKNNGVAIGYSATAAGLNTTVLGATAKAQGDNATALGQGTSVTADNSVALGAGSRVTTDDIRDSDTNGVVSVGKSDGERRIINVADGVNDSDAATVKQVKAVQGDVDELNKLAVTYTDNTKKAVNFNGATLKNVGDIQIGNAQSTFVGSGLVNGKVYDTDAGQWAENGANATHSMAVGSKSNVRGTDSVAVGPEATVNNGNSVVLEQSTAVGSKATVTSSFSTALGANTQAKGNYSVAVGAQSQTTGDNATAIGAYAAAGENSVVVGGGKELAAPIVSKANGTAMGTYVDIKSDNGTALGYGSQVGWNGKNSVALGADSVANEENVVSVGHTKGQTNGLGGTYGEDLNRRITNVADGKNANDAATVGQISKITGMDSGKGNVVQYDGEDKSVVTFAGANGTKLTNLADGEFKTGSTDAVTAGQLYAAGITPGDTRGNAGSVAMGGGYNNYVLGNNGTAIGYNALANENAVAIGNSAGAGHLNATAVGQNSNAMEEGATALGQHAWAEVKNATAIGFNSDVAFGGDNSVALGANTQVIRQDILETDTNGVVSVGYSGKGFGDDEAFNRRIINVADGVNDSDAATVGQIKTITGIDSAKGNVVQYDNESKDQITFGGANGTELLNISNLSAKTATIGKVSFTDDGRITNVTAGVNDSDVATVGQIKNLTGLDSTQGNVVQYDKEGNLNVSVGDSGLKVDDTASSISHGDNSISVGDDGTTVTGDLNVTGDLTFNGETVSSDDLANAANVAGDVSDIKEQIGAGADGTLGLTNEQTTLVGGINANTEAINGVKTIVGDGKLDNGAADLTAGINANSAAIEQNRNAIGALGSRVSDLGEEVDSVGAISAALAGLHPLDYNGTGSKFQISAALGTYDGTQAAAIGGFYHFNRDTLLSIGGSTSFEGDRKTAANVGLTFRVGEGASEAPAVQDTETKQQMDAMRQEIEMLKAELEQLKNKDTEGTNDKN